MDNVGMEASAQLVWQWANALLQARDGAAAAAGRWKPAKTRRTPPASRLCPNGLSCPLPADAQADFTPPHSCQELNSWASSAFIATNSTRRWSID